MNIIVQTFNGKTVTRPDTSWDRKNEDLYTPETVESISFSPVLFARICKPGKSIAERFADRYWDGFGYGVLLYADNFIDGTPEGFASASCLDHTSFLPSPVYLKPVMGNPGNTFVLKCGRKKLFEHCEASASTVNKALEQASQYLLVRAGDLLAIELDRRRSVCHKGSMAHLSGTFCGNFLLDFKIIM